MPALPDRGRSSEWRAPSQSHGSTAAGRRTNRHRWIAHRGATASRVRFAAGAVARFYAIGMEAQTIPETHCCEGSNPRTVWAKWPVSRCSASKRQRKGADDSATQGNKPTGTPAPHVTDVLMCNG